MSSRPKKSCGRTTGHGESCVPGYSCGPCSQVDKVFEYLDDLVVEFQIQYSQAGLDSEDADANVHIDYEQGREEALQDIIRGLEKTIFGQNF